MHDPSISILDFSNHYLGLQTWSARIEMTSALFEGRLDGITTIGFSSHAALSETDH